MATRFHFLLLGVAAVLLLLALAHQHDQVIDTIKKPWQNKEATSLTGQTGQTGQITPAVLTSRPSFKDIALKHGTDKVTDHHYWYMYEKYLEPLRDKKVKMLEIGLGCDMSYGPGKSYYTWLDFFPNVDLYYIEYDAACAEKWKHKTDKATIFAGDQSDRTFLRRFIEESGGDFDIIIDDGGHTMNQQRISFEVLWSIVKPGAYYFIEDLQTSYHPAYGGDPTMKDATKPTMMKYIYGLLDDKMVDGEHNPHSRDIRSIDCMREVCMLTKVYENEVA